MSASLVGSEMCIRDRDNRGCGPPLDLPKSASGARRRRRFSRGSGGVAAPVSYTHLTLPTICSV
eukprot:1040480-Alexandrium_andersonii.AAC.1